MTLERMNDLLNTLFLGRCKGCSNRNLSPIDFISKGRELRWMCSACWAHWLSCHDMIENKDSREFIERTLRREFPNAAEFLIRRIKKKD